MSKSDSGAVSFGVMAILRALLVVMVMNTRFGTMLRDKGKSIKNHMKIGNLHFSNFPHITALIPRPLGRGHSFLNSCNPKPETRFCIAIEEFEAWYLGDVSALKKAYPKTKDAVLDSYQNDSICGTWEKLADAIYPGGSHALNKKGWQAIGSEKSIWAQKIAPHMSIDTNNSPSFCYFRDKARELSVKAVND